MSQMPLTKKLVMKPGYRTAVINAPDGYTERLNPLPEGTILSPQFEGTFDLIQVFVYSIADAERYAPQAVAALKPGGLLWFAYPKKTSKIKTDINRDVGWDVVTDDGWEGVAAISIDDTWSALRFIRKS